MPAKKDEKVAEVKTDNSKEEVKKEETSVEVTKEKKSKKDTTANTKSVKADNKAVNIGDEKHWAFYKDVEVNCICGANFTINTTVPWPIKVETCYQCHPTYNKDKVIKKVVKWRLEKFLEKQKRIDAMKK